MKNNSFLAIGLLVLTASQVATHYFTLPDFPSGLAVGVGMGIMILSLIKARRVSH